MEKDMIVQNTCLNCECPKIKKMVKFNFDKTSYLTTQHAYILPLRGEADVSFDQYTVRAKPGRIIHGCPNKILSIKTISSKPFWYFCIYYDYESFVPKNENVVFSFDFHKNNDRRDDFFRVLRCPCQQKCSLREQIIEVAFSQEYLSLYSLDLEPVLEYLHRNIAHPLSLSELAEKFGFNPFSLSHQFKKNWGFAQ